MEKTEKNQENSENQEKVKESEREQFQKELEALREKYHLDLVPVMDFFEYKVLPEELQLALLILGKHKVRYIFKLVEIKGNDK